MQPGAPTTGDALDMIATEGLGVGSLGGTLYTSGSPEAVERWNAGWGPYDMHNDPAEFETPPNWTPREPSAAEALEFR